jgi:LPXTG-site transpeptidase (sortase) family protein
LPPRHDPYTYDDYIGETSGRRRLFTVLGVCWLFAGLVLIGLAAYTFVLRDEVGGQWIFVRPGGQDNGLVAGAAIAPNSALGDQAFRLVIPDLGIDAPVGRFGLDENASPEVPFEKDLVAWYDFSAYPGTGDNAVFAGHYTFNGEAVFRHLGNLQSGAGVIIRGDDGTELLYRVASVTTIEPTSEGARQWMDPVGADVVTLITCGGEHFFTDDALGGGYTHRQVVRAEFVGVTPGNAAG